MKNVYTSNQASDQFESQAASTAEIHEGGADVNEEEAADG